MATPLKFRLYEAAVTNAPRLAPFMRAVHGGRPTTLREDYSGTAALARAWLALSDRHRAVAVDADARVTRHIAPTTALKVFTTDVLRCRAKADIIAATNFPVGYSHTRDDLLRYLRHARGCLNAKGVFVCDIYGGEGCWTPGVQRVRVRNPGGEPRAFTYEWEQVAADPRTGLVHNAIHFAWRGRRINRAFTYHWRLWSIPELTDAMREAGFRAVDVYTRLADAVDHEGNVHVEPLAHGEAVDRTYVVYVVGRA